MKQLVLPKILLNPVFIRGMRQPLEEIADLLDAQDKPYHAKALRECATICDAFADVCLDKSATLLVEDKGAAIETYMAIKYSNVI